MQTGIGFIPDGVGSPNRAYAISQSRALFAIRTPDPEPLPFDESDYNWFSAASSWFQRCSNVPV
jgi:hypothetical protein